MNTEVVLPLDKMTFIEKMEVIDTIWDHIRLHPEQIDWPQWHSTFLRDLKRSIDEGEEEVIDFDEAKRALLEETL